MERFRCAKSRFDVNKCMDINECLYINWVQTHGEN
ncbi:Uncharacterized protein BM_BM547 [Brugia malayi]|uniref:Uncharacterized protein n=1 Tax=Brugia malayi TaxID=6279 RepID=A0A4E9EY30_BRUMA|nr:Uncharacterized protein BM_BM547 [Brugia malayi]VIO89229.1 Uncharacterized protein BM_BM547 [Brugia malayi]